MINLEEGQIWAKTETNAENRQFDAPIIDKSIKNEYPIIRLLRIDDIFEIYASTRVISLQLFLNFLIIVGFRGWINTAFLSVLFSHD